jgi:hypothetical protein
MGYYGDEFHWGESNASVMVEILSRGMTFPKPTTMFLIGSGLIGLAGFRRQFKAG